MPASVHLGDYSCQFSEQDSGADHPADGTVRLVLDIPAPREVIVTAQPNPVQIDLSRTALLIIDMQNDFLHEDGWFSAIRLVDVSPLRRPVEAINRLSNACRLASVPVFHVNWGIREDCADLPADLINRASGYGAHGGYGEETGRGPALVAGSWGAASADFIHHAPGDLTVNKHRFSGFRDTELDQILRRKGVTTLLFAGVNTDRCVFATLTDAAALGYDCILMTDACATVSPPSLEAAILTLTEMLHGFTALSVGLTDAIHSQISQKGDRP